MNIKSDTLKFYFASIICWLNFIFWLLWLGVTALGLTGPFFHCGNGRTWCHPLGMYWLAGATWLFVGWINGACEWANRTYQDLKDQ